jgi:hypothetical protein
MPFIIRRNKACASHNPNNTADPLHQAILCPKRSLVNIVFTYSNLPHSIRQVEMGVEIWVLQLIECVVHSKKLVDVLTRNLAKATGDDAHAKRAISFPHKMNMRLCRSQGYAPCEACDV